jgi:hypothetical protein
MIEPEIESAVNVFPRLTAARVDASATALKLVLTPNNISDGIVA